MIRNEVLEAISLSSMMDDRDIYIAPHPDEGIVEDARFRLERLTDVIDSQMSLSKEEVVALLANIPMSRDLADEASWFGTAITSSKSFPLVEVWFSPRFSEELDTLKATMLNGSYSLDQYNGCRFSFTEEILTNEVQISSILSADLTCMSRFDINNILQISSSCAYGNTRRITYPSNFETTMIHNFEQTKYFTYDVDGINRYMDYFENEGLATIIQYVQSR